jgi:Uma2 family endonuclease
MVAISEIPKPDRMPRRRRWTRVEFDRAEAMGLFNPEERLELIEGEIYEKDAIVNTPHAVAQRRCEKVLNTIFAQGCDVRGQLPLALGRRSKPLPDIAVVVGSMDDYEDEHPTTALLILEISDTTLRLDRGRKAHLYARFGIQDYWILNLNNRTLEVCRQPLSPPGRPADSIYEIITILTETDTIAPLAAQETPISIADLLPRRHS